MSMDVVREKLHSTANVFQQIDWDRRFDCMTQHSCQNLLTATALNRFGMPTHSFQLKQDASYMSYIDFTVDATSNLEELSERMNQVEASANDAIRQNLHMTPTWLHPEDPEFALKVRSRLLPTGLTGKIRLVEIGGGVSDTTRSIMDCNTWCVVCIFFLSGRKVFRMHES